ncbi:hypothetical protein BC830DRAFT_1164631 [Chytriomyces sp. MP71]|nr:hypothetical protein BC830DRAFT_1164631 [Chytriomyces sp. MP71]
MRSGSTQFVAATASRTDLWRLPLEHRARLSLMSTTTPTTTPNPTGMPGRDNTDVQLLLQIKIDGICVKTATMPRKGRVVVAGACPRPHLTHGQNPDLWEISLERRPRNRHNQYSDKACLHRPLKAPTTLLHQFSDEIALNPAKINERVKRFLSHYGTSILYMGGGTRDVPLSVT